MDDRTVILGIVAVAAIFGVAMVPLYHILQSIATPPESETASEARWEATPAGPELRLLEYAERYPYDLYDPSLGVYYEVEVTPARISTFPQSGLEWLRVLWWEIEVTPGQRQRGGD